MERNQLFCDGMILQANKPVRVFGTGDGTATVAIGGKTATVQASGETWLPKGILLGTDCAEAAEENSLDMRIPDYLTWNMDGNLFLPSINQECWKAVQTAQEQISQEMENVYTVKCADVSETDHIHPVTKVPVAERIAAVLLTL